MASPCRRWSRSTRGRRPGSCPGTRGECGFRRCGWTWIGLPGGGAEGRSAAPECAPPRPATASCRRHAAGLLNVERWGDASAEARRNRRWLVSSVGKTAQRPFGRPDFVPVAPAPWVAIAAVARRGAGVLTAGHARPAATTGNGAKLAFGGRSASVPVDARQ